MVVFDLMGTLFTEGHVIRGLLFPLARKGGLKVSYERMKKLYVDYSLGKVSQSGFRKTVPSTVEKEFLDSIAIDKDMVKTMEWLKGKGYLLGILSNIPSEWGDYILNKFGLHSDFSAIVFSGSYGSRKPDEGLYKIFIEKTGVRPQDCYLVDDKLENLREARFFLMKTVWMKREDQEISFIPDLVIRKGTELKRVLK